jgi:hypothetical protein
MGICEKVSYVAKGQRTRPGTANVKLRKKTRIGAQKMIDQEGTTDAGSNYGGGAMVITVVVVVMVAMMEVAMMVSNGSVVMVLVLQALVSVVSPVMVMNVIRLLCEHFKCPKVCLLSVKRKLLKGQSRIL